MKQGTDGHKAREYLGTAAAQARRRVQGKDDRGVPRPEGIGGWLGHVMVR